MSRIKWLEKTMKNYSRLTSEKSINSKSLLKISNTKHEKRYHYIEDKILGFCDLFMILDNKEETILSLWYLSKIAKKDIAKRCNLSRSTLYRNRNEIANKLYGYRHLIE